MQLLEGIKAHLEAGNMAKSFELPDDEDLVALFASYNLLTAKPTIYAANVAEDDFVSGIENNDFVKRLTELAQKEENQGKNIVVILPDTGERYLSENVF